MWRSSSRTRTRRDCKVGSEEFGSVQVNVEADRLARGPHVAVDAVAVNRAHVVIEDAVQAPALELVERLIAFLQSDSLHGGGQASDSDDQVRTRV